MVCLAQRTEAISATGKYDTHRVLCLKTIPYCMGRIHTQIPPQVYFESEHKTHSPLLLIVVDIYSFILTAIECKSIKMLFFLRIFVDSVMSKLAHNV